MLLLVTEYTQANNNIDENYLQLAKNYMFNNPDSAKTFCALAYKDAVHNNDKNTEGLALKVLGNIYYIQGMPDSALNNYKKSIQIFKVLGNAVEEGNIYNNMGLLYRQWGMNHEAIEVLNKAYTIFKYQGLPKQQTGPLLNLGMIYFDCGDYAKAKEFAQKSYKVAVNLNDPYILANTTNNLGMLYKEMGDFVNALEFIEKSIVLRQKIKDKEGEAAGWHNLGCIYAELGEYKQAVSYINKGLEIRKSINLPLLIAASYLELGGIFLQWDKQELALDNYYTGLEHAEKVGDIKGKADALLGLAEVYKTMKVFSKSLDMYNAALEYYKQNEDLLGEVKSSLAMAELYCDYLKKEDVALEIVNTINTSVVLLDNSIQVQHASVLSSIYLLKKQLGNAYKWLTKSKTLALDNKYSCYNICILFAKYHKLAQNADSIAFYYQKAMQYMDSINLDKYGITMAKAEAAYHWDKKQGEIEELKTKADNAEQATKQKQKHIFSISLIVLLLLLLIGVIALFYLKLKKTNKRISEEQKNVKRQSDLLQKANEQLLEAKNTAEESSRFKSEFLAQIGHELRTPLNGILGYARLLDKHPDDERNKGYVKNIIKSGNTLTFMLNDLQDLSKIESGKVLIAKNPFNPIEVISHAIEELKFMAEEKQINFSIHIDPNLPQVVIGDADRLYQVLANLLSNAIKYSHSKQEVIVEVNATEKEEGNILTFNIIDQGIGISEGQLETIFDSFTRLDTPGIKATGMGLGLSVVKKVIDLQNGEISVQSTPGKGSTFSFSLNYPKADKEVNTELIGHTNENFLNNSPIRILLVEDNLVNQELAKDTIESWGDQFVVEIAENGKEAIDNIEVKEYDLILMDIQMPIMDGYEATVYIRNVMDKPKCLIPIIGMSAHAMNDDKRMALSKGMDDYVIKPFNPDELEQKVKFFVNKAIG
jgi:signal transduction histidine kinase/Tfp pilus assembly protein PilF/ActR/RegA family two-component response regulator